jgi:hypothetical protein
LSSRLGGRGTAKSAALISDTFDVAVALEAIDVTRLLIAAIAISECFVVLERIGALLSTFSASTRLRQCVKVFQVKLDSWSLIEQEMKMYNLHLVMCSLSSMTGNISVAPRYIWPT